jgi:hypothetical protein
VVIPIGDMFERGELTNVVEDQIFFRGNWNINKMSAPSGWKGRKEDWTKS